MPRSALSAPVGAPPAPAARPAPSPCPERPSAGRRARPVPEPRAGAAATAAAKLPPSLLLLLLRRPAEPSRAPRPPYLRACAGSGAAGGSWSRAKATASPAESPDRCAPSPPAPHFLSRPLGLEIPGEARCSPGSSQLPRAGPAQPLSAQAAAGGRACPGRWPRLHLMLLSPPSRGHDSGEGAPRPGEEARAGLRGTARPAPGRRGAGGAVGARPEGGHCCWARGEGRARGMAPGRGAPGEPLASPAYPEEGAAAPLEEAPRTQQRLSNKENATGKNGRERKQQLGAGEGSGRDQERAASQSRSPPGQAGRGAPAAAGRRCQPRVPAAGRGCGLFPARRPGVREAPASPPQATGERGGAGSPQNLSLPAAR